MPTVKKIREHWVEWLVETGRADSATEARELFCFACGMSDTALERCHILARALGGADTVDNLHLLCPTCHKASEGLSGGAYFDWLENWTPVDMLFSACKSVPVGRVLGLIAAGREDEAHRVLDQYEQQRRACS